MPIAVANVEIAHNLTLQGFRFPQFLVDGIPPHTTPAPWGDIPPASPYPDSTEPKRSFLIMALMTITGSFAPALILGVPERIPLK